MRLLSKKQIENNANFKLGFDKHTLEELRMGTAHYLIELGKHLQLYFTLYF